MAFITVHPIQSRPLRRDHSIRRVCAWAFAAALHAGLAAAPAAGQCEYDVTVLPCLYVGDYPLCPTPTGMNNVGQIVGYIDAVGGESARGFVWSEKDGLVLLPNPPGDVICRPYDINDAGTIVGTMGGFWTPFQAFIWDGNQYTGLGIPAGGTYSEAFAINEDGVVVGTWGDQGTGNPAAEAFVWRDGLMTPLGNTLDFPYSYGADVNNAQQIVGGTGSSTNTDFHAFFLQSDGTLGFLPPAPGALTSSAMASNQLGDMCGGGVAVDPNEPIPYRRGFAWINGIMYLVSRLHGVEARNNFAEDINDFGTVVGYTYNPAGHAFVWRDGVTTPLDDLLPDGFTGFTARAIDRHGRIAATVITPSTYTGALLTPKRPPGDLNSDCRTDLNDLLMTLVHFGCQKDCLGDADQDGDTDLADVALVISQLHI